MSVAHLKVFYFSCSFLLFPSVARLRAHSHRHTHAHALTQVCTKLARCRLRRRCHRRRMASVTRMPAQRIRTQIQTHGYPYTLTLDSFTSHDLPLSSVLFVSHCSPARWSVGRSVFRSLLCSHRAMSLSTDCLVFRRNIRLCCCRCRCCGQCIQLCDELNCRCSCLFRSGFQ